MNVTVKEVDGKIVFLRKLAAGGSNHSFGIHVAQLAGVPKSIVRRAKAVLGQLENSRQGMEEDGEQTLQVHEAAAAQLSDVQMSIFQLDDPVLEQVREQILDLDINNLTPVDALMKLSEIQRVVSGIGQASDASK